MNVALSNISTANPRHKISQKDIAGFMNNVHKFHNGQRVRLDALYRASGIKYRYSVLEDFQREPNNFQFFPKNDNGNSSFPSTQSRMEVYKNEAIKIAEEATSEVIGKTLEDPSEITHIITASCTGFYAPGIDIDLIHALGLNTDVHRTAINYMGCYAALSAMKNAVSIASADPEAKVLVICVELCSIHFQDRVNDDFLLANALFGDGAAAMIVSSSLKKNSCIRVSPGNFHCNIIPDGKEDMAWSIGNLGFEMRLSNYVPSILETDIESIVSDVLTKSGTDGDAIQYYAIHPGGKRILSVIEKKLGISRDENRHAHHVLENYGNMSSPTVLFVLKNIIEDLSAKDNGKKILSLAFGPGLTVESTVLNISIDA